MHWSVCPVISKKWDIIPNERHRIRYRLSIITNSEYADILLYNPNKSKITVDLGERVRIWISPKIKNIQIRFPHRLWDKLIGSLDNKINSE